MLLGKYRHVRMELDISNKSIVLVFEMRQDQITCHAQDG